MILWVVHRCNTQFYHRRKWVEMLRRNRKNGAQNLQIMHAEFAMFSRRILTSLGLTSDSRSTLWILVELKLACNTCEGTGFGFDRILLFNFFMSSLVLYRLHF